MPKAGRNFIKKENDHIKVYLVTPAQGGLANKKLIELLSDYLNVKKYNLKIVKGQKSREKLIEVISDL